MIPTLYAETLTHLLRDTEYLNGFMSRNNLMCVWNHPSSTVNDTYVNLDLNHRSCIDHFLVSMNIFHAVLRSYVVESVDNHSHHHPIRLKAKLNIILNTSVTRKHNSTEPFIDLSKVYDEQIYNYEYLLAMIIYFHRLTYRMMLYTVKIYFVHQNHTKLSSTKCVIN